MVPCVFVSDHQPALILSADDAHDLEMGRIVAVMTPPSRACGLPWQRPLAFREIRVIWR